MKIEFGKWKFELAGWLVLLALTAIVMAAVYFATANFQGLDMRASFKLEARELSE